MSFGTFELGRQIDTTVKVELPENEGARVERLDQVGKFAGKVAGEFIDPVFFTGVSVTEVQNDAGAVRWIVETLGLDIDELDPGVTVPLDSERIHAAYACTVVSTYNTKFPGQVGFKHIPSKGLFLPASIVYGLEKRENRKFQAPNSGVAQPGGEMHGILPQRLNGFRPHRNLDQSRLATMMPYIALGPVVARVV